MAKFLHEHKSIYYLLYNTGEESQKKISLKYRFAYHILICLTVKEKLHSVRKLWVAVTVYVSWFPLRRFICLEYLILRKHKRVIT